MDLPHIPPAKQWKYAQIELERRFLLKDKPVQLNQSQSTNIEDLYLKKTQMRLRKMEKADHTEYKLTKKLILSSFSSSRQWISTIYLSPLEYELFNQLPGYIIRKRRYNLWTQRQDTTEKDQLAIDEIKIGANTLWIAEKELYSNIKEELVLFPR